MSDYSKGDRVRNVHDGRVGVIVDPSHGTSFGEAVVAVRYDGLAACVIG